MSFTFKKSQRIKKKKDFDNCFNNGTFVRKFFCFTAVYVLNNLDYSRLGVIVKKKHGCAVVRNYEKRTIKELFRKNINVLSNNYDIVILIKNLSSFDQKESEFKLLLNKIQEH